MSLDYLLKRSARSRHLRLSFSQDGQLVVSAPRFVSQKAIDRFVTESQDWIDKHRPNFTGKKPAQNAPYLLFGKSYQLHFGYQPELTTGWHLVDNQLLYNSTRYATAPKASSELTTREQQLLEDFAKKTIRTYIVNRVPQLHQQMNISVKIGRIALKAQKSCWGSCSSQHNLNFNWHLIHYAPAVIDYVLIHELAHLIYLDHSAKFWALVAKHDGNYKLHRQQLRH